jgi:hypothetical protein
MSEIKVDTIVDAAGTGKPNFSNGVTMNGAALSTLNLGEYNASSSEPSSPQNGSIWWDTTNSLIKVYIAGEWKETVLIPPVWYGDRWLYAGGSNSSFTARNVIEYGSIASSGNGTDFGDLTATRAYQDSASNGTTVVFAGGYESAPVNTIESVASATTGNASDFGDLTAARQMLAAVGGTTGIFSGGRTSGAGSSIVNTIDFVTIATAGNASDFGDHTAATGKGAGATNATRALFSGQYGDATVNTVEYITNSSTGNAQDFGDLTSARYSLAASADSTRAIFAGGFSYSNVMDYFTIASTGNATDFGDLTVSSGGISGTGNETKAVFMGGQVSGTDAPTNVIGIVTIQTTGNASDHGDLTEAKRYGSASSGAAS